jgi:cytoskeletal protein CcmA (bactofilin family)
MFGRRKTPRLSGRIDTLLGRGTALKGDHGNVRGLEGSAPATIWVGEPGRIHGNVEVAVAVINGEVVGNVQGSERVVLGAKARVTGDVSYGVIEMTLGARIEGRLVPLASKASGEAASVPAETSSESSWGANVVRPFDVRQGRH